VIDRNAEFDMGGISWTVRVCKKDSPKNSALEKILNAAKLAKRAYTSMRDNVREKQHALNFTSASRKSCRRSLNLRPVGDETSQEEGLTLDQLSAQGRMSDDELVRAATRERLRTTLQTAIAKSFSRVIERSSKSRNQRRRRCSTALTDIRRPSSLISKNDGGRRSQSESRRSSLTSSTKKKMMKKKALKQDEFCFDGLRVVSFCPDVFEDLRMRWNIDDNDMLNSILEGLSGGGEGDGKSGMLFFTSKDKKYVIKTLKKVELDFFQSFLHDYAIHMSTNPNSLICRFMGVFKVLRRLDNDPMIFVVMNNVFDTPLPIDSKFDLKGSTRNRIVSPSKVKAGTVGKDLNFRGRRLHLGFALKAQLMQCIRADTKFLQELNIVDYSMLLGVSNTSEDPRLLTATNDENVVWSGCQWKSHLGGIKANRGNETYFMAIIDILQPYNLKKMGETFLKAPGALLALQSDSLSTAAISSVPAPDYKARFDKFIFDHVS